MNTTNIEEYERIVLQRMSNALELFRQERSTMPLQYVASFLQVAIDEGHSVNDYAAKSGVAQNVMSRHLLDIGPRDRNQQVGFQWVEHHTDPKEARKHSIFLSSKGIGLAKEAASRLGYKADNEPLTIAEAKQRLAQSLGVEASSIKIIVEA